MSSKIMPFILQPWLFVLTCLAAWINEQQNQAIVYLKTENAVLREKLSSRRILLNDDRRRRLAVTGKVLGCKRLAELGSIFTPDTILRWHRQLVAAKHTYVNKSPGRPKLEAAIEQLIVRLAKENQTWGCDRIQGELKKLGHATSDTTIENVLKRNGIEPQTERKDGTQWREFLTAHWECLAATDFTTVDVWTPTGLKTLYLLFVMELKSRRVQYLGSTENPNETWMLEAIERATADDGIVRDGETSPKILLIDRDSKFSEAFRTKLKSKGVKPLVLPPRSPNMNAYIERFMGTYKRELVHRMIFFGQSMLDHATIEFLKHYHEDRPHQGLENELILEFERPPNEAGGIEVDERLGGPLKSYRRSAA